jgi:hypothetical protein
VKTACFDESGEVAARVCDVERGFDVAGRDGGVALGDEREDLGGSVSQTLGDLDLFGDSCRFGQGAAVQRPRARGVGDCVFTLGDVAAGDPKDAPGLIAGAGRG